MLAGKTVKTTKQIHQELRVAKEFTGGLKHSKMGMRALKDDPCLGCPCEAVTPRKIAKVEELVNDNPHITIRMIEEEVGISKRKN